MGEKKDCAMSVISFKSLDWTDAVADLVDISPEGLGIEARTPMEPGFVWFYDMIDGQKGGLLMWSKQFGNRFRGGIRFVPLAPDTARRVQENIEGLGPLRNPEDVINAILESLQNNAGINRLID
jgi:hypothetical protein